MIFADIGGYLFSLWRQIQYRSNSSRHHPHDNHLAVCGAAVVSFEVLRGITLSNIWLQINTLLCYTLVSVLVLRIGIARGQYYWILGGLLGIVLTLHLTLWNILELIIYVVPVSHPTASKCWYMLCLKWDYEVRISICLYVFLLSSRFRYYHLVSSFHCSVRLAVSNDYSYVQGSHARWRSGKISDQWLRGRGFQSHRDRCRVITLSKLFTPMALRSTQPSIPLG